MLGGTRQVRVYAFNAPADLRNGYDGLWYLVSSIMKRDPMSGDMFVFVSRTRKRAKVLYWDGTGLCLHCKRLEQGHFSAPWKFKREGALTLTMSELSLMLEGSDVLAWMPLSPPEFSLKKD